jgi:lipopolysaccharide O-acetyltransferase
MRSVRRAVRRRRDQRWLHRLVRDTEAALLPPAPWAFHRFGASSVIVPPARIQGAEFIEVGDGALIHEHVWFEVQSREGQPTPQLVIGDNAMLNRFVKIVCLGSVTLGRRCVLSDRVYISDVEYVPGHAGVAPMQRPLTDPLPIVIGEGAFLGVGTVVKPGVTIGEFAYIAAAAIVTNDIPPRSLAIGVPARVVRQYDERTGQWEPV